MKKSVLPLLLVGAVSAAGVMPSVASAESSHSSTGSSLSSQDEGSSQEESATAAIVTLLVLAAVGAGALWFLNATAPQPTPPPPPNRGDCTPEAINRDFPHWRENTGHPLTYTNLLYCDGEYAYANQNATDWNVPFKWDGTAWRPLEPVGVARPAIVGCYNGLTLREQGASEEFINRIPICTPEEVGNWDF